MAAHWPACTQRASPLKTDQTDLARCPCLFQGSVQGLPSQPRSAAYCPVVLPRIPASQPVQPLPAFSESPAAPDSMPSRRSPDTVPGLPLFVRPVVSASAARTPIAPGLCLDSPGHSFWPSGLFGPSCPWGLFGLLRLPLSPLRLCWGKPRGRRGLHARHDLGNRCGWCGWYGWCDSGVCEGRETREQEERRMEPAVGTRSTWYKSPVSVPVLKGLPCSPCRHPLSTCCTTPFVCPCLCSSSPCAHHRFPALSPALSPVLLPSRAPLPAPFSSVALYVSPRGAHTP